LYTRAIRNILEAFYGYGLILVQTLIYFSRASFSNLLLNVNRTYSWKVEDGYFRENKMAHPHFNINELIMLGVTHNLKRHLFVEGSGGIVADRVIELRCEVPRYGCKPVFGIDPHKIEI
jgi:hypothetical protein